MPGPYPTREQEAVISRLENEFERPFIKLTAIGNSEPYADIFVVFDRVPMPEHPPKQDKYRIRKQLAAYRVDPQGVVETLHPL